MGVTQDTVVMVYAALAAFALVTSCYFFPAAILRKGASVVATLVVLYIVGTGFVLATVAVSASWITLVCYGILVAACFAVVPRLAMWARVNILRHDKWTQKGALALIAYCLRHKWAVRIAQVPESPPLHVPGSILERPQARTPLCVQVWGQSIVVFVTLPMTMADFCDLLLQMDTVARNTSVNIHSASLIARARSGTAVITGVDVVRSYETRNGETHVEVRGA